MTDNITESRESTAPIKYGALSYWLTVAIVILLTAIVLAFGTLTMMYKADARVALGNAKSLRLALQLAGTEAYATGEPFADPSQEGGVSENIRIQAYTNAKVPGEFWLLQTGEANRVLLLRYTEGPFTVTYSPDPDTWVVTCDFVLIRAEA